MRIWLISKYASSSLYGYPTRQFFFAKTFAEQFDCDVTLISSRSLGFTTSPDFGWKNSHRYRDGNLKGVVLNGPKIKGGMNLLRMYSWMVFELRLLIWAYKNRKQKPDVIIVSSLSLFTFLTGSYLKQKFKCKFVTEVRDIWPLTVQQMLGLKRSHFAVGVMSFVEKKGYKSADLIVGTMANLKAHVANVAPKATMKVRYIPTGFYTEYFNSLKDETSFEEYFNRVNPNCYFTVAYVGTIGVVNKVDEILNAATLLKDENIIFIILGNGPEKERLMQYASEMTLNKVYFHEAIPRGQVQAFLRHCDLNLNPWADNPVYQFGVSPNKWIDYMYSEKPIIVSLNGYRNIINEAGCGIFIKAADTVALANSILQFKNMPVNERLEMGKRGREYLLKNLTYEILARKYLQYISEA